MKNTPNIEFFKKYATDKGGVCLTNRYYNLKSELIFVCDKNHQWKTNGKNVKYSNSWCPTCSGKQRLTIEDIKKDAIKRGGKCLSEKYVNLKTKLLFECEKGHQWYVKPDTIRNSKKWCPHCNCKDNIETYKKIAIEKGGECLSKEYVGAFKKLEFKCKEGHVWETSGVSIKHQNTWCPKCGGKEKHNINTYKLIAKERGGECLSNEYGNIFTKLEFKCKEGHVWETKPNHIKNKKTWCPICKESKGEQEIRKFLDKNKILFEKEKSFPNCKNKNKLRFDFYLPKQNILIEYDGIQHHEPIKYFGGLERFKTTQEHDTIKTMYAKENTIRLLRINYNDNVNNILNKEL